MKREIKDDLFGIRLKAIRKSLKLTQSEFAEKMEISVTNLSDIENGKTHPCHDFFYRILKEFKVNLNYCLSGGGSMFLDMEPESSAAGGEEIEKNRYYYDVEHEDIREFLDYFFSSKIVRYHIISIFMRMLNEDQKAIEKDLVRLEKAKTKKSQTNSSDSFLYIIPILHYSITPKLELPGNEMRG